MRLTEDCIKLDVIRTNPGFPMARIIPDGWRELSVTGAAQREIETLAVLADGLPDDYSVYHAVHWTGMDGRYAIYGEIDFVVVNLAGDLLLIEQKSGFLDETPEGLVKQYPGRSKSVPVQMSRMVSDLRGKLAVRGDIPSVHADALLYCPDYTVKSPETAGLVPERIVDATRRDQLCQIIQRLLPAREETPATPKIHAFLRDMIQLETDVSALIGHARNLVTRVSGGLAHWARQLEFDPFRLRVTGTAGSGKTQLALAEYRAALEPASGRSMSATTARWPTTSTASPRPAAWPAPTTSCATSACAMPARRPTSPCPMPSSACRSGPPNCRSAAAFLFDT